MKALRIKTIVRKNRGGGYFLTNIKDNGEECHLCKKMYQRVIGKEVIGKVTFVLKKIKGEPTDYIHPFRISVDPYDDSGDEVLEIHDGKEWEYAKWMELIGYAADAEKIMEWAGDDMFSVEMEWIN